MKTNIAVGALLLGVLLLAGCSRQQTKQNQETTQIPGTQQETADGQEPVNSQLVQPSQSDNSAVVVPGDWKTYTNKTYGFEVEYPNTWTFSESADHVNFMEIGGQDVSLTFYIYNKTIDESKQLLPLFSVPGREIDSSTNVTINNIGWIKFVVDTNQIAQLTYKDGKTYAAQYSTLEDISPKILSTFKFTNGN
jgi:hypothetical protein